MLKDWGVDEFEITTLNGREDRQEIIDSIEVDRETIGPLDPERYLGHVHYYGLPLCDDRSDLTARFHILRASNDQLALELFDIAISGQLRYDFRL
ncbi:MAG: hypothetical protein AAFW84_28670 [Cyanobacteria bacterium J06635_15]